MDKNGMSSGALVGLEQVNISARARRHVERQIRFAAMIVDMVIGKSRVKNAAHEGVSR